MAYTLQGVLKVNLKFACTPIYSRIALYVDQNELQVAVLIGWWVRFLVRLVSYQRFLWNLRLFLEIKIRKFICLLFSFCHHLPKSHLSLAQISIIQVNFFLLRRLLGVRTKGSERQGKVSKLAKGEILMLNIGSISTGAPVLAVKNDLAMLQLTSPVCTSKGEKIALSRRVEKHRRLIGWGQIQAGTTHDVPAASF
ncbi:hypothetical protein SAY86_029121 [Trapa natans]|uniref:Initiation factor eIF2 gamma C-terminal domain-containing protein n=1 Tax=Trapa natans TaxID=22666 RepID=A0AAN7MGH7_TRANT|nr:hypothetical protein SAY86_029121 [Trapa natans]